MSDDRKLKWEYDCLLDLFEGKCQSHHDLNNFGSRGWELVCVLPLQGARQWVFKRPVKEFLDV